MTSKEALKMIQIRCRYFALDYLEVQEMEDAKKIIEKDLEILDLIHDHPIEFSWVAKSKNYTDYIFIGGTTLPFRFSEEEFNKIKEWMKND